MNDPAALQRRAAELEAKAEAIDRRYTRETWVRFTVVFFPVPMLLVMMRLSIESWTYYIFGAVFVGLALSMYALDNAARNRLDVAIKAAEEARALSDNASSATSSPPNPAAAG